MRLFQPLLPSCRCQQQQKQLITYSSRSSAGTKGWCVQSTFAYNGRIMYLPRRPIVRSFAITVVPVTPHPGHFDIYFHQCKVSKH